MTRYLQRRLLQTIPVLMVISVIQFWLINAAPGGPIRAYLENPEARPEDVARLEQMLGLHEPLPVRYIKWLAGVLHGDFGRSYFTHQPVLEMIAERLPATLELSIAALLVSWLIGIPLGVYAGLHRGSRADHLIRVFTAVLSAVPHWWLALLLIVLFANVKLATGIQVLPTGGIKTIGLPGFNLLDYLWHLCLPALMVGTAGWVGFARLLRSETLEVLSRDYIRTAYAKGLAPRIVTYRHVLRNALVPVVTIAGGQLPGLMAGSVIYENIFTWPGMGQLTVESMLKKDYPVSVGVLFILTLLVILGRLLADLAYHWVDPRITYDQADL